MRWMTSEGLAETRLARSARPYLERRLGAHAAGARHWCGWAEHQRLHGAGRGRRGRLPHSRDEVYIGTLARGVDVEHGIAPLLLLLLLLLLYRCATIRWCRHTELLLLLLLLLRRRRRHGARARGSARASAVQLTVTSGGGDSIPTHRRGVQLCACPRPPARAALTRCRRAKPPRYAAPVAAHHRAGSSGAVVEPFGRRLAINSI